MWTRSKMKADKMLLLKLLSLLCLSFKKTSPSSGRLFVFLAGNASQLWFLEDKNKTQKSKMCVSVSQRKMCPFTHRTKTLSLLFHQKALVFVRFSYRTWNCPFNFNLIYILFQRKLFSSFPLNPFFWFLGWEREHFLNIFFFLPFPI